MDKKTLAAVVIHLLMALYEPCLQLKQLSHSRGDWVIYQKKVSAGACVCVCMMTSRERLKKKATGGKKQQI